MGGGAHNFVESSAVVAGCGGYAGAVAREGAIGDEAGLCAVIRVIAGEDETFVCTLCGKLWNKTRRLRALIASLVVHCKPSSLRNHNPCGPHPSRHVSQKSTMLSEFKNSYKYST